MPCIEAGVVSYLFETIGDHDAAIPCWSNEMIEPLHAVYRRSALLDYLMSHDSLSLRPMIRSINTCYVSVDELKPYDLDLVRSPTLTNLKILNGSTICKLQTFIPDSARLYPGFAIPANGLCRILDQMP